MVSASLLTSSSRFFSAAVALRFSFLSAAFVVFFSRFFVSSASLMAFYVRVFSFSSSRFFFSSAA